MENAINNPGMSPAANSLATETPVTEEKITNGMDGGITGAIVEEAAERPH